MVSEDNKKLEDLIRNADEVFWDVRTRKNSKKKYEEALKIAIKSNNAAEIAYINGKLAFINKNCKEALRYFEEAVNINSKYLYAWHYKGLVFDNLKEYNKSINCYEFVLDLDPNFVWSLNNLGVVYAKLHEYEKAAECYDKVIEKDLNDNLVATACYNKGHDYYDWGEYSGEKKYFIEALKWFNKAIEKDPLDYYSYNRKGLTYHRLEEYNKAINCYNKALEIEPDYLHSKRNKKLTEMIISHENEKKVRSVSISKKDDEIEEEIIEDVKFGIIKELLDKYPSIKEIKTKNENKFSDLLKPREKPLNENFLMVLRRWNSYTPAMITEPALYELGFDKNSYLDVESNLGGGYFLRWNGKGIVIDPGFDFLDNFFYQKLTVHDIDAVIITHAHIDHYIDFEPIFTLIYEYNDNIDNKIKELPVGEKTKINELKNQKKKIDLFMNLGVLKKMLGWIPIHEDEKGLINRVYPLEKDVSYTLDEYNLKITAKAAIHNEILSKQYAVGLIFTLYLENKKNLKIGFTSDTKYKQNIINQYEKMDIIIPHLGSIEDNIFDENEPDSKSDHLMLNGIIPLIYKSRAKLAIISEFGEELGKERLAIADVLNETFYQNLDRTKCFTGDIGLKVKLPELELRCDCCTKKNRKDTYFGFKDILEDINKFPINKCDNGVVYFCEKCYNVHDSKIKEK